MDGVDVALKAVPKTKIFREEVHFFRKSVKSVSKVLGKIPKPAVPTLQEDLSQDL